jgi:hypothetical protein
MIKIIRIYTQCLFGQRCVSFFLTAKSNDNVVCFFWTKFVFLTARPNVNLVCLFCINDYLFDRKSKGIFCVPFFEASLFSLQNRKMRLICSFFHLTPYVI